MSDNKKDFLGKISIAILEHSVANLIGEESVKLIRNEVLKEVENGMAQALWNAEERFVNEYKDREITDLVRNLPLANLPDIEDAIKAFCKRPTDPTFSRLLVKKIVETAPQLGSPRIEEAVTQYMAYVRQELVVFSPESTLAERLIALTLQSIEAQNTTQTALLKNIESLLGLMLAYPRELENSSQTGSQFVQRRTLIGEQTIRVRTGGFYMNQYDRLRSWLDLLVDQEFRDVIQALLTVTEQNTMPRPVGIISRTQFLGHMQALRRLQVLEDYLLSRFGDRFGGENHE